VANNLGQSLDGVKISL